MVVRRYVHDLAWECKEGLARVPACPSSRLITTIDADSDGRVDLDELLAHAFEIVQKMYVTVRVRWGVLPMTAIPASHVLVRPPTAMQASNRARMTGAG
jgi:hypothetical protein